MQVLGDRSSLSVGQWRPDWALFPRVAGRGRGGWGILGCVTFLLPVLGPVGRCRGRPGSGDCTLLLPLAICCLFLFLFFSIGGSTLRFCPNRVKELLFSRLFLELSLSAVNTR